MARAILLLAGLSILLLVCGCARSPSSAPPVTAEKELLFDITVAGNYNNNYYYFIALDADGDPLTGPLPVVAGPYWGNGWGTGSFGFYAEQLGGFMTVYDTQTLVDIETDADWLLSIAGDPDRQAAGFYLLDIQSINYGAVTVTSPDGLIASASNAKLQSAGTLAFTSDAAGNIVAGTVSFTPAALGGRPLTSAEQAVISAANAGGPLTASTFSGLGITLALGAGPYAGGAQSLAVAATTGAVRVRLQFPSLAYTQETTGTVYANSSTPTATPPVPGVTLTTGDLATGQTATLRAQYGPQGQNPRQPVDFTSPIGSNHLRFSVQLSDLAPLAERVELNLIFTDVTPLDPGFVGQRFVDALGPNGNDFVSLDVTRNYVYYNTDADVPEQAGDCGEADLDIVDWTIEVLVRE